MPHLTRSARHRCWQRHGISRLPAIEGTKSQQKKGKRYPLGSFHIDRAEVRTDAHRLTPTNHPWTNGQMERMHRTIKEATVKTYWLMCS
jgi:hypothetical protein